MDVLSWSLFAIHYARFLVFDVTAEIMPFSCVSVGEGVDNSSRVSWKQVKNTIFHVSLSANANYRLDCFRPMEISRRYLQALLRGQ